MMEAATVQQDDWASYATICRLCLQRDGFMLGIFNRIQGKEKSIYKKIMDCTALEVNFRLKKILTVYLHVEFFSQVKRTARLVNLKIFTEQNVGIL